jgi:hypothetical protein
MDSSCQLETNESRLKRLECGMISSVEISNGVIIICSYDL